MRDLRLLDVRAVEKYLDQLKLLRDGVEVKPSDVIVGSQEEQLNLLTAGNKPNVKRL